MSKYFYTTDEMESLFRSRDLEYPSQYSLDELQKIFLEKYETLSRNSKWALKTLIKRSKRESVKNDEEST